MAGKERWRKHVKGLDLEGFPKAWITRGLREIHHVGDHMDGKMDACLGYTGMLGAEIYKSMGELREDLREDQKKRALDGWERMDMKRQLEDSLHDTQGEIADLKARVDSLELLVDKLTCPTPCHDFHFFTYFLLSSKRPNTSSNHDMVLSYLFTLQSHTIKTRKADSIAILTKNYLIRRRSHDPLILLIRLPNPIEVQLVVGIVPTMRPSLIIRLPVQVLIDNLTSGQTRDLVRETDVRKRRGSRTEDGLPRNSRRRIGQLLDHPLERLDASLGVSDLQLTLPGILSVLLIKKGVKEDTP